MVRKISTVAFWVLAGGIVFATLCPIELRPSTGHVVGERFAAYLMLGAAAACAWPKSLRREAAVVILFAVGLELAQRLIPTRHGLMVDSIEKVAGGVSGLISGFVANKAQSLLLRRGPTADAAESSLGVSR